MSKEEFLPLVLPSQCRKAVLVLAHEIPLSGHEFDLPQPLIRTYTLYQKEHRNIDSMHFLHMSVYLKSEVVSCTKTIRNL